MRAAIEFLGVEWISSKKSFVEQAGPLLGSLIVGSVAAFAAWLAARTANERQRQQLDHDLARQREMLTHDRAMRDQDFLRHTISSVVENALKAVQRVGYLRSGAEKISKLNAQLAQRDADSAEPKNRDKEDPVAALDPRVDFAKQCNDALDGWRPHREEAATSLMTIMTDDVRLSALLGPQHQVRKGHDVLVESLRKWFSAINELTENPRTDELAAAVGTASTRVPHTLFLFQNACRETLDNL
ncbi:MAG TPA: hypothetical protein VHS74_12195 [Solirubrobacterales bacterium]|jgi:hypothetical protein|nr:hypothetical protein [Solirubrobacterales bacterium]